MTLTAHRLDLVKPSATYAASQRARDMKAQGIDVISLGSGEPDFPTPDHIVEAAIVALRAGETRYTDSRGSAELRAAIQRKFRRENSLDYGMDQIIVGPGAKSVVASALNASLNPGDEVIVPAPYWVSYTDLAILLGGKPIVVPCSLQLGLKLDPETLEASITPRTRWLIMNSPTNPTGVVYSTDELRALGEVLKRHPQVLVLSDEIYEHLTFDGVRFASFAGSNPDLMDRIVTVNGVSKAYAMTGWRIGYAGGPKPLIAGMAKLASHFFGCSSSVSQIASIVALDGQQDFLAPRANEYALRRDRTMALLDAIPGLKCLRPEGAFYLFVNCVGVIGKRTPGGRTILSDVDFSEYLVEAAHVVVVAGAAYGLSPWFRVSIATAMPKLEEACQRIAEAVADLS